MQHRTPQTQGCNEQFLFVWLYSSKRSIRREGHRARRVDTTHHYFLSFSSVLLLLLVPVTSLFGAGLLCEGFAALDFVPVFVETTLKCNVTFPICFVPRLPTRDVQHDRIDKNKFSSNNLYLIAVYMFKDKFTGWSVFALVVTDLEKKSLTTELYTLFEMYECDKA